MESAENLLVIGKEPSLAEMLKASPVAADFRIHFCRVGQDILDFIKDRSIRIAILDFEEIRKDASSLLRKLKQFDPLLHVVMIGGPLHPEEVLDWIHQGATDYLVKPLEIETIYEALKKASEKRELRRETFLLEKRLEKKYVFQGMTSKNPYMLEIFGLIENIARYFTNVLITGETGTGKEMVARAIHDLSGVENRKLVVCDCASIPESLFESEFFGYVRGAFTGADRNKRGLFEDAHEGTLFLDEIGDVPMPVQAKLLRALETRQFRPLGSNEVKYVNVRIIAASNRNLAAAIKQYAFREDLYHRLNRVEIHLPPLRERPEDIPLLVRHFLHNSNKAYGKSVKGVSRDVQKLFRRFHWPGNIRELENVLQSAVLVSKKDFIDLADLPKNLRDFLPARSGMPFIDKENLFTLDDLEKEYIAYLLKVTNHNLKKTAKILSISRTTLYNKLGKYNLQ
jgi:DNA-binding NtrC family response regulator